MGCFNYSSSGSTDFTSSQIYISSTTGNPIEILDCLQLCQVYSQRYAHFLYTTVSKYSCACSNSYNTYSTIASDTLCNFPW